jgi:hypothetical protein
MMSDVPFVSATCNKTARCVLAAVATWAALRPMPSAADDYNPVTHAQLQAVLDGSGHTTPGDSQWAAIHPTTSEYPVSVVGVVINNPGDMLNWNAGSASQWQTFVQALPAGTYGGQTVAAGDFGGSALFMIKSFTYGTPAIYDDATWNSEMNRLNYCAGAGGTPLQSGDVVLVQAKSPGLFYNGKFNINEQHHTSPDYDFNLTILQRGYTPAAANIALNSLKDANNNLIFDGTRATGCEHYQGSLVHLDNLLLADPSDWANGGTVMVTQGSLTFPMQLGLDPALAATAINAAKLQTTPFSVTAIVDQEGGNLTAGYSLWLTNAGELALTGDANHNGTINGADLNAVLSNYNATGATWAMGDFNGDGTVNGADLNTVLSNYNQSLYLSGSSVVAAVPEPSGLLLAAAGAICLLVWARKRSG